MIIPIPANPRNFFRMSLELIKPIPPLNKLRPKELDVLSEFLYYNYKYKDLDPSVRWKVIFDYDTKMEMKEYLSMDEQSFNNHLTTLRKNNILSKRSIGNDFGITPEQPFIKFDFKLSE